MALPAPTGPARAAVFHLSPSAVIEEKGLKLKLTVTDTPGFGDQINNDKWWVLGCAAPVPTRSVKSHPGGACPLCHLRVSLSYTHLTLQTAGLSQRSGTQLVLN